MTTPTKSPLDECIEKIQNLRIKIKERGGVGPGMAYANGVQAGYFEALQLIRLAQQQMREKIEAERKVYMEDKMTWIVLHGLSFDVWIDRVIIGGAEGGSTEALSQSKPSDKSVNLKVKDSTRKTADDEEKK
jgi:hypothetical protein